MTALAALRSELPRAVIGRRLRNMPPRRRRDLELSARQTKALCGEEHDPQHATVTMLAKADPVIRAKVIVDCLPDEIVQQVAHLRWDDWDDQIEFHKIIMRSLAGGLE